MSFLTIKEKIHSLVAKELELCIPQFTPQSLDYQMVLYACQDFEVWTKIKWYIDAHNKVYDKIAQYLKEDYEGFMIFLRFWTNQWFDKWKERVIVLANKPQLPPHYLDKIKKAKKRYQKMDNREELKQMTIRKLVKQGEICMSGIIAENLIIEEIVKRIQTADDNSKSINLEPLEILNNLSYTISRLPKEKGPLIYLDIKTYML